MNFLMGDIAYIRENTTENERLNQLAEECCELAQAALKLERATGKGQYCAKSPNECISDLKEEIADVENCIAVVLNAGDQHDIELISESKLNRWCNRLSEMGRTDDTEC